MYQEKPITCSLAQKVAFGAQKFWAFRHIPLGLHVVSENMDNSIVYRQKFPADSTPQNNLIVLYRYVKTHTCAM